MNRTLIFVGADPAGKQDRDGGAASYLLTALEEHCSTTILATGVAEMTALEAESPVSSLSFEADRELAGVLSSLVSTMTEDSAELEETIVVVSHDLLGPVSNLEDLFTRLDSSEGALQLLTRPDPEFSGEQGTEDLGLDPLLIQLSRDTLFSPAFMTVLGQATGTRDLLSRASKAGISIGWAYDSKDGDYLLRALPPELPLLPWAVFTSDPLLLERWAVSSRTAYETVSRSDYPFEVFWDHLTHAVPPQTWYTNLALLDIPSGQGSAVTRSPLTTAICAHVFYPEMLTEMVRYASNVPQPVSLFITTSSAEKQAALREQLERNPHLEHFEQVDVRVVSTNDGRDISAFLVDCADVIEDPRFDLIVKMHSKASVQDPTSVSSWFRSHLFENLFGTAEHVGQIYNRFVTEPQLGMVFPPVIHMGLPTMGNGWTANRIPAQQVGKRLGIDIPFDTNTPLSPYGSMFISRREPLLPLVQAQFQPEEFPRGDGYRDGSLAHVLERLYSYVVFSQGYFARCVQTPANAEISAVTLEYKLDAVSAFLHPHVLEQVKMLDPESTAVPSVSSLRSQVQRALVQRFPKTGTTLTNAWMRGKRVGARLRSTRRP